MVSKRLRAAIAAASLSVLAGCDAIPPELEGQWLKLQRGFTAFVAAFNGEALPQPSASPSVQASPSPSPMDLSALRARNAKANAELLHEVYLVVFGREPRDRGEFGSLVDSMNQGASLEGMYNGFAHSEDYRKLESTGANASPGSLKTFGEELAVLEAELPVPVDYDQRGAPVPPPAADGVTVIEYGKGPVPVVSPSLGATPSLSAQMSRALAEKYSRQLVGSTIFTLKRLIGDEALRVIAAKRQYPEKLASWYARWVTHMAARKVDYGISLRNQPDEAFHYKWAMAAGEDRITWEVLNRLHRALNEANRPKQ